MRIEAIKISNFRQYKNMSFEFPKTTEYDIHIIEASNGVGKTTLINAVNWCLYGDEPHTSGSSASEDKLPLCNLSALEEAKKNEKDKCTVSVVITATADNRKIMISREADFSSATLMQSGKDRAEVQTILQSGETKIYTDKDSINDIIGHYLPRPIREYFFFDGEQLLYYFDPDKNAIPHIRDCIYQIAGVTKLESAKKRLGDIEAEITKKISKLSPDLDEKIEALNEAHRKTTSIETEIQQLSDQISLAESEIAKADDIINGTGDAHEKNTIYNSNKAQIVRLQNELMQAKRDLQMFIRKYAPRLLLYKINKSSLEYIQEREHTNNVNTGINLEALKETIRTHKCKLCEQAIPHSLEEHLEGIVQTMESNQSLQKLLAIKGDISKSLNLSGYESEKDEIFQRIHEYEDSIKALEQENENIYAELAKYPSIESIEEQISKKRKNEALLRANSEKLGSDKNQLEFAKKEEEQKKKEYETALQNTKEADDLRKRQEFLEKAEEIVKEIRDELVREVKENLQTEAMELFNQLIWKKDTYDRIELDESFRLKLIHKLESISSLGSGSAAEKEMLALAFTLAIHGVSGYDSPLMIDTPVGRVSDQNRAKFATVLLEVSKNKQIILEVTPSEYSAEIKQVLNESVVSSYTKLYTTDEMETIEKR